MRGDERQQKGLRATVSGPLRSRLRRTLPRYYADDVRMLVDLVGDDIDLRLWPNFAQLALASSR